MQHYAPTEVSPWTAGRAMKINWLGTWSTILECIMLYRSGFILGLVHQSPLTRIVCKDTVSAFYALVFAHTHYICVSAMRTFFGPPWPFLHWFPSKKFLMPTTNATSWNLPNSQLPSWEPRNSVEGQERALGTNGVKRNVNKGICSFVPSLKGCSEIVFLNISLDQSLGMAYALWLHAISGWKISSEIPVTWAVTVLIGFWSCAGSSELISWLDGRYLKSDADCAMSLNVSLVPCTRMDSINALAKPPGCWIGVELCSENCLLWIAAVSKSVFFSSPDPIRRFLMAVLTSDAVRAAFAES